MSIRETINTAETSDIVYLAYDPLSSSMVTKELEKVGYHIKLTSSIGETIFCLRKPDYAALIIGPLVQANDKILLASELRRRGSKTKIVFLYRDHGPKTADLLNGADAILDIQNGASAVVETLRKLISS